MIKVISAIIENHNGSFLLHLRDSNAGVLKNQWCLVCGAVEQGETIQEAVKREVKEETNLNIQSLEFIKNLYFNNDKFYTYHGYVDDRKNKLILGEGAKLQFFKPEELIDFLDKLGYSNVFLDLIRDLIKSR